LSKTIGPDIAEQADPITALLSQHEALLEAAAMGKEGREISDDEMMALMKKADEILYRLLTTTPTSGQGFGLLLQHLNKKEWDHEDNESILDSAKTVGDAQLSEAAQTFLGRLGTTLVELVPD
jgi:hypothetical protein